MRPTGSQYKYSHSEKYSLSSANHSRGKTMLKFIVPAKVHCAKVFTANSLTSSSRCTSLYKLARQGDFFKKLERLEATTGLY